MMRSKAMWCKKLLNIGGSLGMLLAAAAIGMHTASADTSGSEPDGTSSVASAGNDLRHLSEMMGLLSTSEMRLVATIHDVILPLPNVTQFVSRMLDADSTVVEAVGKDAAGSVILGEHAKLTVSVHNQDDQAVLVARLEIERIVDMHDAIGWIEQLENRWSHALQERPEWRLNLQAPLASHLRPEQLWSTLDDAGARSIGDAGHYDDGRSVSRSYDAPFLQNAVRLDGSEVHLQAAVHRSSEDGAYRITLGTPLITMEY